MFCFFSSVILYPSIIFARITDTISYFLPCFVSVRLVYILQIFSNRCYNKVHLGGGGFGIRIGDILLPISNVSFDLNRYINDSSNVHNLQRLVRVDAAIWDFV